MQQGQRLGLVQQQRLNLSPQMVQSLKLMTMPFADLRDRILEEVETNPALEIVSDPFDSADPQVSGTPPGEDFAESSDYLAREDWTPASLRDGPVEFVSAAGDDESDDHQDYIEGVLRREETLQEHLLAQLAETPLAEPVRSLAAVLIQNLDQDGFHLVPPEELPEAADPEALRHALDAVRRLEPRGCACRDYLESLSVQARLLDTPGHDPFLARVVEIIERHFDCLEKPRPDALVKALRKRGVGELAPDEEDAADILDVIRSLDPFPGRAFGHEPVSSIKPDVIVVKGDDGFSVIINDEEIPVVGISPFFMELGDGHGLTGHGKGQSRDGKGRSSGEKGSRSPKGATADQVADQARSAPVSGAADQSARDFARESVREARWFMDTLTRRNLTILKVARALVVYQRDFFLHGPARLAPLRMKDIADETGLVESTISRAANGKYLQCEWGLFELRYFFSNQVGSGGAPASAGNAAEYSAGMFSKQGVKEVLREILAAAREPLSDQKVADLLAVRGIKIARRTVAKYRAELDIGSSFER